MCLRSLIPWVVGKGIERVCVNKEIYYQKVSVKYVILKELIIAKKGEYLMF